MPNMVMGWVGELLIGIHSASTPTDAEWRSYLDVCAGQKRSRETGGHPRQLIITSGGGPNLEQRRLTQAEVPNANIAVAVVSGSGFVRFVVAMLVAAGTNTMCKAFTPDEMDEALRYLGATDRDAILSCITTLTQALEAEQPTKPRRFWQRRRASAVR